MVDADWPVDGDRVTRLTGPLAGRTIHLLDDQSPLLDMLASMLEAAAILARHADRNALATAADGTAAQKGQRHARSDRRGPSASAGHAEAAVPTEKERCHLPTCGLSPVTGAVPASEPLDLILPGYGIPGRDKRG